MTEFSGSVKSAHITDKQSITDCRNENIVISAFKRLNSGEYMIRLYNGRSCADSTVISILNAEKQIHFGKFEIVTLIYSNGEIRISDAADLY